MERYESLAEVSRRPSTMPDIDPRAGVWGHLRTTAGQSLRETQAGSHGQARDIGIRRDRTDSPDIFRIGAPLHAGAGGMASELLVPGPLETKGPGQTSSAGWMSPCSNQRHRYPRQARRGHRRLRNRSVRRTSPPGTRRSSSVRTHARSSPRWWWIRPHRQCER